MKSIKLSTKEETYYKSMYAAQQKLGINGGIIKMVYEGLNNCIIVSNIFQNGRIKEPNMF